MPLELLASNEIDLLLPLLLDADEGVERIRRNLEDSENTRYVVVLDGTPIGAALMRWHPQESELIYIAMMEEHRGQGHGKAVMNQLLTLARQRRVKSLVVGTANSSSDNILFYQKCGFRINSVRKNYFNYFESPVYEHGIEIRDMLVFSLEIE